LKGSDIWVVGSRDYRAFESYLLPAAATDTGIDGESDPDRYIARGAVVLQTIWATTPNHRAGHRRTDVEHIADVAVFMRRLAELAPAICRDAAAPLIKAVP
jgi:hypothetical protein